VIDAVEAELPDLNALDAAALKALIVEQRTELIEHRNEIQSLKLLIFKLRKTQFGPRSEKLKEQIDQLELKLDELETNRAAVRVPAGPAARRKPARRPLPAGLPREIETIEPKEKACPDCGGSLSHLGNDVCETLEYVPPLQSHPDSTAEAELHAV